MVERPTRERKLPRKLVYAGADALGALAGISTELVFPSGGLIGATTAAVVTETLASVGEEIEERALAPREHQRVGAAYYLIATEIQNRLLSNEEPRTDGFWEDDAEGHNTSEELLEGILLSARDSYERRKIPFLANLYSNFAFDSSVSRFHANHLISLADQMTYMELVALSILSDDSRREQLAAPYAYPLEPDPQPGRKPPATPDSTALVSIMFGLFSKGLIMGHRSDPQWGSVSALNPRRVQLSWSGHEMVRLAGLIKVASNDRKVFFDHLKRTCLDTDPDVD